MLIFESPEILYLFILVPIIIIIHLVSLKGHKRRALTFANFDTIKRLQGKSFSKDIPLLFLRLIFLSLLILSFAGSEWEYTAQGYPDEIILALDTSGSMLASDLEPSRFEAAKSVITEFISNNSVNARMGLLSFTSLAQLHQETTLDKALLLDALDQMSIENTGGTSLAVPISFSELVFETDSNVLVLLTDGQENIFSDNELRRTVEKATDKGIIIHVIGIGTEIGAPITEEAEGASVLNTEVFSMISEVNGGNYSIAGSSQEIRSSLSGFFEEQEILIQVPLSFYLFISAIIVLIIEWYFSNYLFRAFP